MTTLRIRTYPDPVLRKRCQEIRSIGEEERKLMNYMTETMRVNEGVGLAAQQVGILKRLIVIDAGEGLLKMANPEISSKSGLSASEEGCLSLPGKLVEVDRPEKIKVSFTNEENQRLTETFHALTAKAIQHEIDHLNGKLIIDYLPWYQRIFPKKGEAKCPQ